MERGQPLQGQPLVGWSVRILFLQREEKGHPYASVGNSGWRADVRTDRGGADRRAGCAEAVKERGEDLDGAGNGHGHGDLSAGWCLRSEERRGGKEGRER